MSKLPHPDFTYAQHVKLREIYPHGNSPEARAAKQPPRAPTNYDDLFRRVVRPTPFTLQDLCANLAITLPQARAIFSKEALRDQTFPDTLEDAFLDAAANICLMPEQPWLEHLYTPEEAAVIFTAATNRAKSSLRAAIVSGELPAYRFAKRVIRLRRTDIETFCKSKRKIHV